MNKQEEFEEKIKCWRGKDGPYWPDWDNVWNWIEAKDKKQKQDIIKMIEERISYGKKFRLNKKDNLRSGWTGIESGECCEKCKMRDEDFNGSADALKAIVGCRNPFQLKKTCECHLPFRKVAEESIQQALQLIKEKICNNGTPNK